MGRYLIGVLTADDVLIGLLAARRRIPPNDVNGFSLNGSIAYIATMIAYEVPD